MEHDAGDAAGIHGRVSTMHCDTSPWQVWPPESEPIAAHVGVVTARSSAAVNSADHQNHVDEGQSVAAAAVAALSSAEPCSALAANESREKSRDKSREQSREQSRELMPLLQLPSQAINGSDREQLGIDDTDEFGRFDYEGDADAQSQQESPATSWAEVHFLRPPEQVLRLQHASQEFAAGTAPPSLFAKAPIIEVPLPRSKFGLSQMRQGRGAVLGNRGMHANSTGRAAGLRAAGLREPGGLSEARRLVSRWSSSALAAAAEAVGSRSSRRRRASQRFCGT